MEESKKYADMALEDFIQNVLHVELTDIQKHLVRLFDENRTKKVEYITTTIPAWSDGQRDIGKITTPYRPYTTYGSGDIRPDSLYTVTCEDKKTIK